MPADAIASRGGGTATSSCTAPSSPPLPLPSPPPLPPPPPPPAPMSPPPPGIGPQRLTRVPDGFASRVRARATVACWRR